MVTIGIRIAAGKGTGTGKGTQLCKAKGEPGPLSIVSDRLACSNRRSENLDRGMYLETPDSRCCPYFVRPANPLDDR